MSLTLLVVTHHCRCLIRPCWIWEVIRWVHQGVMLVACKGRRWALVGVVIPYSLTGDSSSMYIHVVDRVHGLDVRGWWNQIVLPVSTVLVDRRWCLSSS